MSLIGGSSTTTTRQRTTPTNPQSVEAGVIDYTRLINSLANRNPQEYVTPASPLQNKAFSIGAGIANRYGATNPAVSPQAAGTQTVQPYHGGSAKSHHQQSQLAAIEPAGNSGLSLFEQAGVQQTPEYDWAAYVNAHPDVQQAFLAGGKGKKFWGSTIEEFGEGHYNAYGSAEGRSVPLLTSAGGVSTGPAGAPEALTSAPQELISYAPADLPGANPLETYASAIDFAREAGAQGPASYQAATYTPGQIEERIDLGDAPEAIAQQGAEFADVYKNQYLEDVVAAAMKEFDENAGRVRAQEAARGSQMGAFGGSQYGVQRAETERQLADERVQTDAGLRFSSADRAFSLGMQDANRFASVSEGNAAREAQRQEAQGQLDFARAVENLNASNQGGLFNTASENDARRFNATEEAAAADRKLNAAQTMTGIASTQQGQERADLATLSALGEAERGIARDSQQADLDLMKLIGQLYGVHGVGAGLTNGQLATGSTTSSGSPGLLTTLGSLGMGLGALGWDPLGGNSG